MRTLRVGGTGGEGLRDSRYFLRNIHKHPVTKLDAAEVFTTPYKRRSA